ncbi:hypothetical protein D3C76_1560940 [compost metagenome]
MPGYTAEALYDLVAGRYSVLGLKNEEQRSVEFGFRSMASNYTPAALRQAGVR